MSILMFAFVLKFTRLKKLKVYFLTFLALQLEIFLHFKQFFTILVRPLPR